MHISMKISLFNLACIPYPLEHRLCLIRVTVTVYSYCHGYGYGFVGIIVTVRVRSIGKVILEEA